MKSKYLDATFYIDSDHANIKAYANKITKGYTTDKEKSIALFNAVRDGYFYNPYDIDLNKEALVASTIMTKKSAYCIEKAILLCAVLRASNIPARLHFGNVKNHIAVDKIIQIFKSNILVFHGCTEVFLNDTWIKITPAFNKSLCTKLGVPVLEFDGEEPAVFQKYSATGAIFIEYVHDYGSFDDMPYDFCISEIKNHYPHIPVPENLVWNFN